MKNGCIRSIIPIAHQDTSKWPKPDENGLTRSDQDVYRRRKRAVEMYAAGAAFSEIRRETGKSAAEVRRLVHRCIGGKGQIPGFHALCKGYRAKHYERKTDVAPKYIGQRGGCSGALQQCLQQGERRQEFIERLLFRKRTKEQTVHEARISYKNVHLKFLRLLKKQGVREDQWPFNTKNYGRNALRKFCHFLVLERARQAMQPRFGVDAARRNNFNPSKESIIPVFRPFTYVALDFHKVDAAGVIVLVNDFGVEVEIPVSRFWYGVLFEEYVGAVLGFYVSFEANPSAECVLETIESGLRPEEVRDNDPRLRYCSGSAILIHQILPTFAFHGFSVLKVDNAWANAANQVVNNIIDTVGCAVYFGPKEEWWIRAKIERFFREAEAHTLQRLPSTYGSGPSDTRRADPALQAIRYRITLTELVAITLAFVQSYNKGRTSETLQAATRVEVLKAALDKPDLGFVPQPLPRQAQADLRLLKYVVIRTIRGNLAEHTTPYIKVLRCRYTNGILTNSYHLVGKKVIVYIDRRRPWLASAVIKDSGVQLGQIVAEKRLRRTHCTMREFVLLDRESLTRNTRDCALDGVSKWEQEKHDELNNRKGTKGRKKAKISKQGTKIAAREWHERFSQGAEENGEREEENTLHDKDVDDTEERPESPPRQLRDEPDPFGLNRKPSKRIIGE